MACKTGEMNFRSGMRDLGLAADGGILTAVLRGLRMWIEREFSQRKRNQSAAESIGRLDVLRSTNR